MSIFHHQKILTGLCLLLLISPVSAQTPKWKLVFREDFQEKTVDTKRWSMYNGPGHAGNGLRKPSAFSVSKGNLVITAQMKNGQLVSGGMAHKANFTYGKFVFRVRTEADHSGATSGVVLTWPKSERWPQDGENDMYETGLNPQRNPFKTFIHYGDLPSTQYEFTQQADGKDWHTMTMEWTKSTLKMYRDGKLVWTLDNDKAIPDVPHHICLQLDAFKKSMGKPVRMYVDWVKIYQAEN